VEYVWVVGIGSASACHRLHSPSISIPRGKRYENSGEGSGGTRVGFRVGVSLETRAYESRSRMEARCQQYSNKAGSFIPTVRKDKKS